MKIENLTEIAVASSEKDAHGDELTENDLQEAANLVNDSAYASPYLLMHDRSIAPLGKIVSARVVYSGKQITLLNTVAPFKISGREIKLNDKTLLFEEICIDDARPALGFGAKGGFSNEYRIHVDQQGFENLTNFEKFKTECDQQIAITSSTRKSAVVDALFVFLIAKVGEKLFDKAGDKLAEKAIEKAKLLWDQSFLLFRKHAKQDTSATQQVMVLEYSPIIELHCHSDNSETMSSAFQESSLLGMLKDADECKVKTAAARVHFKWTNNSWEIQYVQTENGQQFLSKQAQLERTRKAEELEQYLEDNNLEGGVSVDIKVRDRIEEK